MKNKIKKLRTCAQTCLLLLVLCFAGSFTSVPGESTCPGPVASVSGLTSSSASFSWAAVTSATEYAVWYVRQNDNFTSSVSHTSNTSIGYSGLGPGRYNFYFATVCDSGLSEIIVIEDLIMN